MDFGAEDTQRRRRPRKWLMKAKLKKRRARLNMNKKVSSLICSRL